MPVMPNTPDINVMQDLSTLFDRAMSLADLKALAVVQAADLDLAIDGTMPAIIAAPNGVTIHNLKAHLDQFRRTPDRIRETIQCQDTPTLIRVINRFARRGTAMFVDLDNLKVVAVLDYHGQQDPLDEWRYDSTPAADRPQNSVMAPSFATHRAAYDFPLSTRLKAWLKQEAEEFVNQSDFAEFLVERIGDVQTPPPNWMQLGEEALAELYDLLNLVDDYEVVPGDDPAANTVEDDDDAEDLKGRSSLYKLNMLKFCGQHRMRMLAKGISIETQGTATAQVDRASGQHHIEFKEEHGQATTRGNRRITVPEYFLVRIPIFEDEPAHLIPVRLSYRVRGGNVLWRVELVDISRLVRQTARKAAVEVADETAVHLYFGTLAAGGH